MDCDATISDAIATLTEQRLGMLVAVEVPSCEWLRTIRVTPGQMLLFRLSQSLAQRQ